MQNVSEFPKLFSVICGIHFLSLIYISPVRMLISAFRNRWKEDTASWLMYIFQDLSQRTRLLTRSLMCLTHCIFLSYTNGIWEVLVWKSYDITRSLRGQSHLSRNIHLGEFARRWHIKWDDNTVVSYSVEVIFSKWVWQIMSVGYYAYYVIPKDV